MTRRQRSRALPAAFLRRQQRIHDLLALVPPSRLDLQTWSALHHAQVIVDLTPREFADYAIASATLLRMAARQAVAR